MVKSEMDTEEQCCSFHFQSLVCVSHVWDQHFQDLFIGFSGSNFEKIYRLKYNSTCLSIKSKSIFLTLTKKLSTLRLNLEKTTLTWNSADLWIDLLREMVDETLAKKGI